MQAIHASWRCLADVQDPEQAPYLTVVSAQNNYITEKFIDGTIFRLNA